MSMKNCRVCGKPYEPCKNPRFDGTFNWKEVACSPECGKEYLRRILKSRGQLPKEEKPAEQPAPKKRKAKKGELVSPSDAEE